MQIASLKKGAKIIGLIFLLLVGLLAVIFLTQGVKSYFVKASTCPAKKVSAVKVSANSAVISWETDDVTQGRVEYGTNATNLTFSAPEGSSGKIHNVPLTLLTPNTVYYYLVTIGKKRCDSSGQTCSKACVPWSFTTKVIIPQKKIVAPIPTATPTATPTQAVTPTQVPSPSPTVSRVSPTKAKSASPSASPTKTAGFCSKVQSYIGKNSQDRKWPLLKQYDIDGNNIINGLDLIKCRQTRE